MKIIVSHGLPFALAHGGTQTLIESLMAQARAMGLDIEPERWWDENQKGDILHYVGRPLDMNVQLARQKGYRMLMTEFLDRTASRSPSSLLVQRGVKAVASRILPAWTGRLGWGVYRELDALVYVTELEANVAASLFGAPRQRLHVIPHGLPEEDIASLRQPAPEQDYLVCLATIHPRKNPLLLARAANQARVPVRFVGRPYGEGDAYFREFLEALNPAYTRYEGFVTRDRKHELLRQARGFVLLSEMESGCFAVYEAAAAGLPQLLSNRPWASRVYNNIPGIDFVSLGSVDSVARSLAGFYRAAHRRQDMTFPVASWLDITRRYAALYQEILS
jgi:glycosyltransferase involved in cell wall biosynthesis